MPRYHFNVQDGQYLPDEEGCVLPDLAAARREAVRLSGRLLDDDPQQFWAAGLWNVIVTDDMGQTLFVLTFSAQDIPASAPLVGVR